MAVEAAETMGDLASATVETLRRHVWNEVLCCVITMDTAAPRFRECLRSLAGAGFPTPYAVPGEHPRAGVSVADAIHSAHRRVACNFVARGLHRYWDLMVIEDDARLQPRALEKLTLALEKLRRWRWTSLHVGHVPLGPCLPLGSYLCVSVLPFTGHMYVLNREKIAKLLRGSSHRWKRPFMIEGNLAVPIEERFAMLPSICYQSVQPKEMKALPLVCRITYCEGEVLMTALSIVEMGILVWLVLHGAANVKTYLNKQFV